MQPQRLDQRKLRKSTAIALSVIMLAVIVPSTADAASARIEFGFPAGRLQEYTQAEGPGIGYGTVWAGAWNERADGDREFNAIKTAISQAKAVGATPLVHWWYWGDNSGNVACYTTGCQDPYQPVFKTRAGWDERSVKLADEIREVAGPGEVIVNIEPEFNKGDSAGGVNEGYSDEMNAMLAAKVDYFQSRGIEAMITPGNWRHDAWHKFSGAVMSGDYAGVMLLWSCLKHSSFDNAASQIVTDTDTLLATFPGMDIIVPDFGVSSYSCDGTATSTYTCDAAVTSGELRQENIIKNLTLKRTDLKNNNVVGFIFRELVDVDMNNANFHGAAEDYWGFKCRDAAHTPKPAYDDVVTLIESEQTSSGDSIPGKKEAESFSSRPVGGLYSNAAWSNGQGWNVWANGSIEHTFTNAAAATYVIEVRAMGAIAAGVLPHFTLRQNGALLAEWDAGTTVATYSTQATLAAGTVTLRITFTNDCTCGGQDRNLIVDYVEVKPAGDYVPGKKEVEAFQTKSTGAVFNDAAFSGGQGWNLWTNGHVEHTFASNSSGSYRIDVRAKGDLAGPVPPHMVLKKDGVIVAEWDVASSSLATYSVTTGFGAGSATLRIEYTNDYNLNGEDRNIRLDFVEVAVAAPTVPGTVEAENFAFKSTGAAFNSASYSGGKGWNIWTNGYIEQKVYSPTAKSYVIEIRAAGDLAGTEPPRMVLKQNGVVVATWDVVTTGLLTYPVTRSLPAGETTFRIEFTNDYNLNGQDRNLKVDLMRLV